jgi:hypothetical protein
MTTLHFTHTTTNWQIFRQYDDCIHDTTNWKIFSPPQTDKSLDNMTTVYIPSNDNCSDYKKTTLNIPPQTDKSSENMTTLYIILPTSKSSGYKTTF